MADRFTVVLGTINGATVAQALRLPSSNQESQEISNVGPATVYLGQTGGVTTATGVPFPPGSELRTFKNGSPIYGIVAAGTSASVQVSPGIAAT